MSSSGLAAEVRLDRGALALDVTLEVAPGELVVLVGPNGAGKSTLVRALAGLLAVDSGRVMLDGEVLDDPEADRFVPPNSRSVGVVFQDLLLFEHLDVLDNVAFGLRCRRVATREARRIAADWLDRMELGDMARLRPRALSGGQAQRVALARALAFEPRLLLLDEPLAALDATTRAVVRRELRAYLAAYDGARLLVTHDPIEAIAFADRIVVFENGRVAQQGTPDEIRARPRSPYVADLIGVNFLRGSLRGSAIELAGGASIAVVPGGVPDGPVAATIHPRAVALHTDQPHGSARNVWTATVRDIDDEGDRVRVRLGGQVPLVAEVTPAARDELALVAGSALWVSVKATEIGVQVD